MRYVVDATSVPPPSTGKDRRSQCTRCDRIEGVSNPPIGIRSVAEQQAGGEVARSRLTCPQVTLNLGRMPLSLLAVNVARPAVLLRWPTGDVFSPIDKRPVTSSTVEVGQDNLVGDQQADTRPLPGGGQVHGGPDKAVYAYSQDHAPAWVRVLGAAPTPGLFGENLTVAGATERDVCIGDVWRWGTALLQVSQPRIPCYKLGIRLGAQVVRHEFRSSGRVGWYLRVPRPGTGPTSGPILAQQHDRAGVCVYDVNAVLQHDAAPPPTMLTHDALAAGIRRILADRNRDITGGVPEDDG